MKFISILTVLTIVTVLIVSGCASNSNAGSNSNQSNQTACTQEAKQCPDGSYVGRTGPNCEFSLCPAINTTGNNTTENVSETKPTEDKLKANECTERTQACTREYMPVCGWFNQSIQCIKYPCAATYSNKCEACADGKVDYWTSGACPKDNAELSSECTALNGTWLPESKECEGISKEQCDGMNGNFDECASACRNDPNATICTMQCVIVCRLQ